ncbi:hypothetical protein [Sorangium cellulosum]|uniref:hypothetical protein n=1 Tax=Sorangium cellulosum TaxID=56 RepID=UPI001F5DCC46|nr:hypothetical protein [Sorangium cellulosum]
MHVRYFHELRQIVSDSRDPDCVALVAMLLFELGASGSLRRGPAAPGGSLGR